MGDKLSTKKIIIWMGAFLLVAVSLAVVFKSVDSGSGKTSLGDELFSDLPPVTDVDWVIGTSSPRVVLIEYSDFECPACASYYPLVERIVEDYADDIQFVYRHFPLPQHSQAKSSASAAEAAGLQGKFFEMHRTLFDNQRDWAGKRNADKIFEEYASDIGLDMEKYRTDVESREIKNKVGFSYSQAIAIGVRSTPTFFLNGKKINNPRTYEEFKTLIDAELGNNP